MLPLLLDVATTHQCCHSSSMLPFLLRCFHSSYCVAGISPMLLLLLQYCCSFFNIAAHPSMLPLHLDVAIAPSILTLCQCCHSLDGLMFLQLPILMLLHCCCCFSLNVASTCNAPVKLNYFQLQVLPTGHYTRSKLYPEVFDLFTPTLMFSILL